VVFLSAENLFGVGDRGHGPGQPGVEGHVHDDLLGLRRSDAVVEVTSVSNEPDILQEAKQAHSETFG
jgi:hypothetical protein